jgi:hypothetical protein
MGWECVSVERQPLRGRFVQPPDDISANMEHRRNDADRGKPKESERNLSRRHSVHRSPTRTDLDAKAGLRSEEPTPNRLSYSTSCLEEYLNLRELKEEENEKTM